MMRFLAWLVLSLSVSGVVYATSEMDKFQPEQISRNITIGRTTLDEVKAIYGDPDSVSRAAASQGGYIESISYRMSSSRTHTSKIRRSITGRLRNYLPNSARRATETAEDHGAGNVKTEINTLSIAFDRNGIVRDYRIHTSNDSEKL